MQGEFRRLVGTVEPRFGEVPRDWGNCFVISGARYNKFVKKTKKTKEKQTLQQPNQTKQKKQPKVSSYWGKRILKNRTTKRRRG